MMECPSVARDFLKGALPPEQLNQRWQNVCPDMRMI
ncbi:TPA: hypothetical protein RVS58_RS19300 [Escherichia coli]